MKSLDNYNWDQLYTCRYDNYPFRLVIVSPLSFKEVKKEFDKYIIKHKPDSRSFETFLKEEKGVPSVTAIFRHRESEKNKKELFAQIATAPERVKFYSLLMSND